MRNTRLSRDDASSCTSNETVTRRLPKQPPPKGTKRNVTLSDDPIPSTSTGITHNQNYDDYDLNDSGSDQEYIVEDILRRSVDRSGHFAYYIKWKGYSIDECTWEPVENCDCPELIQRFELSIARHVHNRMCIFQGLPEQRASAASSPVTSIITKQPSKQKPTSSSQQPRGKQPKNSPPKRTAVKRNSILKKGDRQPSPPKSMQIIGGRSLRSRKG